MELTFRDQPLDGTLSVAEDLYQRDARRPFRPVSHLRRSRGDVSHRDVELARWELSDGDDDLAT